MVKLFGTTISETKAAFNGFHFGNKQSTSTPDDRIKAIGRIVISIILLLVATWLVTSGDKTNHTTGSTIFGAILGYWLK